MADSWFRQPSESSSQHMNDNAHATFSRRGRGKRFREINEALPEVADNYNFASNMDRAKVGHMLASNTTVPGRHLHGLGSIHMNNPDAMPDAQAEYHPAETGNPIRGGEDTPAIITSPRSVSQADNPRKQFEMTSDMVHEIGHHVEHTQNPDFRPLNTPANEARAENYSLKHTKPSRHGLTTPLGYDTWHTPEVRYEYPGGFSNQADKQLYRATRVSGQQPGDEYLDEYEDKPTVSKLSKQFKPHYYGVENNNSGWEGFPGA